MNQIGQFSLRTLLEIMAAVAVVLVFLYPRTPAPAPAAPATTTPGRFMLVEDVQAKRSVLFDTQTGACFERYSDGNWHVYTAPLKKPPVIPAPSEAGH
jgi:hypothetical protein